MCVVCVNDKVRVINRRLLMGGRTKAIAAEFGIRLQSLSWHKKRHLPWRSRFAKEPVTVEEQLAFLKLELRRLQILAECGEPIGGAIRAITARRQVLELEARLDHKLGATHRKLFPAEHDLKEDFEVVFTGGSPRTMPASEARKLRGEE
jgi:hypothetical protein